MRTMFAQVDSLPGTQVEPALSDGDRKGATQQRRLDVGRHVVGAFARMPIGKRFRSDRLQGVFQIVGDVGIGVFVNRQRCRGMLQEQVEQSHADFPQFRQGRQDLLGDEMKPTRLGGELNRSLQPRHRWFSKKKK